MTTQKKEFVKMSGPVYEIDWRTSQGRAELELWKATIKPFFGQSMDNIFAGSGKISGVDLYMHKAGIYVFSWDDPFGRIMDLNAYRWVKAKMRALDSLEFVEQQEAERLAKNMPPDLQQKLNS